MYNTKFIKFICLSALAVMLNGCGTGTRIDREGQATDLQWKRTDQVILNHKQGIFPDQNSLAKIQQGMTKDQLYALIGAPHYNDGWRPKEWNYLFYFRTLNQGKNSILACQYKVTFDHDGLTRKFFWRPVSPETGICPPMGK